MISFLFQFSAASGDPLSFLFRDDFVAVAEEFILSPYFLYLSLGVAFFLILGNILLSFLRHWGTLEHAFSMQVLLVQLPRQKIGGNPKDTEMKLAEIQEAIGTMENFYHSIAGGKAQKDFKHWLWGRSDHVGFEIVAQNDQIRFYLSIPKHMRISVEQQLLAQFPYAYIEEVVDYNIFKPQCFISTGALKMAKPFFLPIKTYKKFEADPLGSLTNVLAKVDKADGVAVQFLVRSARGSWHHMGPKVASTMQKGKSYSKAYDEVRRGIFAELLIGLWDFFDILMSTSKKEDAKNHYNLSPMEQEMVKGMEEKTSKAGMDVNIRVVAVSSTSYKAEQYVDSILDAFNQFNVYEYGNGFKHAKSGSKAGFIRDFIYRRFESAGSCLLNTEEMAGLYHLPLPGLETPKVLWLLAKKSPPPPNLPKTGVLLGRNYYRGVETKIRISREDRRRHVYIIGQTGVGKSVLAQNMAIQDITNGDGVCVIDPHGELVEYVLEHIPENRIDDVVYFDPSDTSRPIALNLLEFENEQQKTFVINETLAIFDKLYDLRSTGGPMFEQYMRNALLLIMSDPDSGSTMMEVSRVLADENFRKYKLSKCTNPTVRDFWTKEAEKAGGEAALANMVPYITSKMTPFIANDLMRPIIAQQKSAFSLKEIMDGKKILLLNLSKGKIGEMNSNLLGMVMIGKILLAALGRVDMPMEERKDFYLYIDEFQNFITDTIGIILSEARKYRLSLTMAHQFIAQLTKNNDTRVRDAVFGNVGTKVAFRVGIDDAELIAKQFAPVFNEYDVINVPKFTSYCKLLVENENPPAFNLHPYAPTSGNRDLAAELKALSRIKYGRDRRIVEAEILERVQKTEDIEL
ncbi:MAG: hypothetical protein G01um101418_781 [Parcubacteria group bacterium Gr01-1014_18]|nr:MAG: hypothetical protein Greene041636_749 [Parcubacteria group bacterium Greene0416_36]TSC80146.1 MAG: hypothetical protein G01um101418_781 [Parcubacteria group bacterium Gr01-1014_18]TSC99360.1 MAG: hypothetical protein Greene101420_288 [Parcubacteria group bacterium Greene1014_20]TSD06803.1 MAG: hypothetical protein Greene07142_537 [Parcubacteria group bacterium Greene0714_2]